MLNCNAEVFMPEDCFIVFELELTLMDFLTKYETIKGYAYEIKFKGLPWQIMQTTPSHVKLRQVIKTNQLDIGKTPN